jgi:hypothetical protein
MPRPRTNDPLGVSDNPKVVTDHARLEELTDEYRRRLLYVSQNYQFAVDAIGSDPDFKSSHAKLQRSLARKRPAKVRGVRAHPDLELAINRFAREHAEARTGTPGAEVTQEDANAGARKAAELLNPHTGRSRNWLLRYHVEGLMALIQETTGKPVQLTHYKDNDCPSSEHLAQLAA